jgi:peroxiredoxin Q/BCP
VWQKKKLYGKEFWGIRRTTFLIGRDGKIRKVWDKVRVDSHHRDVLEYFE